MAFRNFSSADFGEELSIPGDSFTGAPQELGVFESPQNIIYILNTTNSEVAIYRFFSPTIIGMTIAPDATSPIIIDINASRSNSGYLSFPRKLPIIIKGDLLAGGFFRIAYTTGIR